MFFDNNAKNIEVKDYSLRILKIAGSIFSGQKKGEYAVRKCPNGN